MNRTRFILPWVEKKSRRFLQSTIGLMLVILLSTGCKLPSVRSGPQVGTIKIVNTHVRGSDSFPGGMYLPDTRQHGICIIVYPLIYPSGLAKPPYNMILANDEQTTTTTMGSGMYLLQEWQNDSEINQDLLYVPQGKTLVRPIEIVRLNADDTIVFGSERTLAAPGDFVEGAINPLCRRGSGQPDNLPQSTPIPTLTATPSLIPTPTPLAHNLTSHLILDEVIDFPLCWVGSLDAGMRPCADVSAPNQSIDIVLPTIARFFEFELQSDTWWALELNRVIDGTYPGKLGVDIQYVDANGNWAGGLSYFVNYPTTGTTTRNGALEGQPIDPDWMNKIPYNNLWNPIGPGKYRIVCYSYVSTFDGAVNGYWPSRGSIKVYSFDNVPPP